MHHREVHIELTPCHLTTIEDGSVARLLFRGAMLVGCCSIEARVRGGEGGLVGVLVMSILTGESDSIVGA